jgi:hypothetical protein
LGGLNIFWVILVDQHLASALPGLGDFPANRVRETDAIEQALRLTALPKSKSLCGDPSFLSDAYSPMESK